MNIRDARRPGVAIAAAVALVIAGVLATNPPPGYAAGAGRHPMPATGATRGPAGQLAYTVTSIGSPPVCTPAPSDACTISNIFVVNADGSGAHQLSQSGVGAKNPVWSPDGRAVAFSDESPPCPACGSAGATTSGLKIVGSDGTGERTLDPEGGGQPASWSPDGTEIVYQALRRARADGTGFAIELRVIRPTARANEP